MSSTHDFIHSEFPYLYHYDAGDSAWHFHDILDLLNRLAKQREGVRAVLAKKSLSVEQKLTFIQAIVGEVEEDLQGIVADMASGSLNARVFEALFGGDDISILQEIE